jgi:hypothetical protein
MQRRWVHCLLVCVALAAALLVPSRARATFLPACELHVGVTLAAEAVAMGSGAEAVEANSGACRSALDERPLAGEARFAPMCDARGASTEAPPRIHGIGDEHIEGLPSCAHELSSPTALTPSPREIPSLHAGAALADHAVLPASMRVPPAFSEAATGFLPPRDEARTGERQRIDHPPR